MQFKNDNNLPISISRKLILNFFPEFWRKNTRNTESKGLIFYYLSVGFLFYLWSNSFSVKWWREKSARNLKLDKGPLDRCDLDSW